MIMVLDGDHIVQSREEGKGMHFNYCQCPCRALLPGYFSAGMDFSSLSAPSVSQKSERHSIMGNQNATFKDGEASPILSSQRSDDDKSSPYLSVNEDYGAPSTPYMIIESHVTCFTCQGIGRIPRDQEKDLVALIPYSDQRLKPRRTKLYVSVAVAACIFAFSLVIFFLFPRSIDLESGGLNSSVVSYSTAPSRINLNTTHILNVTNKNYYGLHISQLDVEVLHVTVVIGKVSIKNLIHIAPLGSYQVFFTVNSTIGDDSTYNICTWPKIKVHNIFLHIQGTVTCSLLGHSEQLFFEDYQYVDCRSNSTVPRLLYGHPP
ncbi:transmembrane protein 106A [Ambystoma mexicanum]|uniref:transmembrane protein 106A n=1 Tax=Ambystoma mexicanum TaxID=8296 RepID=UPI0037E8119A